MPRNVIKAVYTDFQAFASALKMLKDRQVSDYEAYGPTNLQELEHLMPARVSPVRFIAILCAVIGLLSFWFLSILASTTFDLIVGGKLPKSNVPFVVPAYEGTILIGAIGAFLAGLAYSRLWIRRPPADYDTRLSDDRYGIVVTCEQRDCKGIVDLLSSSGAEEINETAS